MSGEDFEGETHVLRSNAREVSFQRFRVVVVQGLDQGRVCTAASQEIVIGTSQGNDLVVTDPTVSRHHCSITFTARGFMVKDLGTTNGIVLAGHRVEAAYLQPGSLLTLGKTTIRFECLDEEVREPLSPELSFGRVIGQSPSMRRLFAIVGRVAASEATVLLEGETGTGKGAFAHAIHKASARGNGPFVVIDCGAIPATLIESELFGHERGAFTGANVAREGAFEAARGGTVFLDEIGELPIAMQPKLLRALEDRVVQRVGGRAQIPLDVRVIAATNRDLREEVNRGNFRPDLFYRLNVVQLRIPPLRERVEDIPLLAEHFFRELLPVGATPNPSLVATYIKQSWPGNVRELRNTVERDVVLGETADASYGSPSVAPVLADGSVPYDPHAPFRVLKERAIAGWESAYLRDLLVRHGGNLTHAARAARMDRNYLRELLRRHRIGVRDDA